MDQIEKKKVIQLLWSSIGGATWAGMMQNVA